MQDVAECGVSDITSAVTKNEIRKTDCSVLVVGLPTGEDSLALVLPHYIRIITCLSSLSRLISVEYAQKDPQKSCKCVIVRRLWDLELISIIFQEG